MDKKTIELTAEDAELIAEALTADIEECYRIKTDGQVFGRATDLKDILGRIADRFDLSDFAAMEKVKGMDPDHGSGENDGTEI